MDRTMLTARIYVTLKPGVLDAQGDTVKSALETLGFKGVEEVRIGKFMLVTLNSATREEAKAQVEEMCRRLLANPVIEDYTFDLEALASAITAKTKIIYLCNPNNPTGTIFKRGQFERFVKQVPEHVLIILDEAYYEFTRENPEYPDSMTYRLDNVVTLRTFSKAYGMAGVRLGYGLGHDYLIGFVNRIKLPFEPNILAQHAGLAALADEDFLKRSLNNNTQVLKFLAEEFDRLGLKHIPSSANFIMVDFESREKVERLHNSLLRRGIAIRPLAAFGLPHCFRVTCGLPEENEAFLKALRMALK